MRIEGFTAEFMLESSFYQFQNSASIPQLKNEIEIYQQRFENIVITNEPKIEEYYNLRKQSDTYQKDFKLVISQFTYCVPFINAGRLIRIIDDEKNLDYGWGIVINFNKTYKKNPSSKDKDASTPQEIVIVDVLVQCVAGTESDGLDPVPCPPGSKGDFIVLPCALSTLANLSSVKLNALARDIKSREARMDMGRSLNEVMRRYDGKPPLLDPVKDMRITDDSFKRLLQVLAFILISRKSKLLNLELNILGILLMPISETHMSYL
jgi:ATP-dependent RNA helicase DOB1